MKAEPVVCWSCRWEGGNFPCRPAGSDAAPDPAVVAADFVGSMHDDGTFADNDHLPWSWECFDAATEHDPDLAWAIVLACLPLLRTVEQAGHFAAGFPENLVHRHGEAVIDRIEALARRSPRVRFVPSGVWPQGRPRTDPVWQRFERACAPGPLMTPGVPLPPA